MVGLYPLYICLPYIQVLYIQIPSFILISSIRLLKSSFFMLIQNLFDVFIQLKRQCREKEKGQIVPDRQRWKDTSHSSILNSMTTTHLLVVSLMLLLSLILFIMNSSYCSCFEDVYWFELILMTYIYIMGCICIEWFLVTR